MNISATLLGQIYVIWSPVYLLACFLLVKQFKLPKVVLLVAVLLIPFLPLTAIYLIVLTAMGILECGHKTADQT